MCLPVMGVAKVGRLSNQTGWQFYKTAKYSEFIISHDSDLNHSTYQVALVIKSVPTWAEHGEISELFDSCPELFSKRLNRSSIFLKIL